MVPLGGGAEHLPVRGVEVGERVVLAGFAEHLDTGVGGVADGIGGVAWGSNASGMLGLGDKQDRTAPAQVGATGSWQRVTVGPTHACARQTNSMWCAGGNTYGQLGLGDTTTRTTPTQIPAAVSRLLKTGPDAYSTFTIR